jgi:hypothetical protein
VQRITSGHKGQVVTGARAKVHNEFRNLQSSANAIRVTISKSRQRECSTHVTENAHKILVENLEGMRPIGRPRHEGYS